MTKQKLTKQEKQWFTGTIKKTDKRLIIQSLDENLIFKVKHDSKALLFKIEEFNANEPRHLCKFCLLQGNKVRLNKVKLT